MLPLPCVHHAENGRRRFIAPARDESASRTRLVGILTNSATALVVLLAASVAAAAQIPAPLVPNTNPKIDADVPPIDSRDPITVTADRANRWTEGVYDVWYLEGHCSLAQGSLAAKADAAVLWIERGGRLGYPPNRVIAYFERNVEVKSTSRGATSAANGRFDASMPPPDKDHDRWIVRLTSTSMPTIQTPPAGPEPNPKPATYQNAVAARMPHSASTITRTQYTEFGTPTNTAQPPAGTRRVRFFPRSGANIQSTPDAAGTGTIITGNGGWNVVIDGLPAPFGSVDLTTDRFVVWTGPMPQGGGSAQVIQTDDTPLEIYMEGNVEFRQGKRVIRAPAMYYDVRQKIGVVLNADLLTPLPTPAYPGLVRLRANVLRQVEEDRYVGEGVSFTTSRFGLPTFEVRADVATFDDIQHPIFNALTGTPEVDPRTGVPQTENEQRLTAYNNYLYVEDVPVFYWPVFSGDLERGNFFLNKLEIKQDSVFGWQVDSEWDMYQLLGIRNPPKGTTWDAEFDYYSLRGPAAGTEFRYGRDRLLDVPGKTNGLFDAWFIEDSGFDNLGLDRRMIEPEDGKFRGRILGQHRQQLPNDWQITAELGWQSDRNFLEEYFLREFDTLKDQSTDIELRRNFDNASFTITGAFRLNQFYTETQWLPKLDHFWLGQPLADDTLTWYEHTSAGYANQNLASKPTDPTDASKWTPLPWESPNLNGQRLATRNEIDWPVQLGPVKVVPYALGELANWGEDLAHDDLSRAYGIIGLRASIPFWAVDPTIQSDLFNVHGVAHKVDLSVDASLQQSTDNLANLPLYDQINDQSIQHFERRFAFNTYGMPPGVGLPLGMPEFPLKFDPRYYLLRRGSAEWVTGPTEIAGDLSVIRLDADQRWQTKRGPLGDQHIIDWITLDTELEIFPDTKQNFGSAVGLFDYDFRWYVGDRVTLVSSGAADFFSGGQEELSFGAFLNRPQRGNVYLGYYFLDGDIRSNIIATSFTYRMSEKWAATFGTTFNISPSVNIGQSFTVTRIGESFLTTVGVTVDASRGTVGASFMIEPRALGQDRLIKARGLEIPPAGVYGLE